VNKQGWEAEVCATRTTSWKPKASDIGRLVVMDKSTFKGALVGMDGRFPLTEGII